MSLNLSRVPAGGLDNRWAGLGGWLLNVCPGKCLGPIDFLQRERQSSGLGKAPAAAALSLEVTQSTALQAVFT